MLCILNSSYQYPSIIKFARRSVKFVVGSLKQMKTAITELPHYQGGGFHHWRSLAAGSGGMHGLHVYCTVFCGDILIIIIIIIIIIIQS